MVVRKVSALGKLSAAEHKVIAQLDTGEFIVLGDGSRPRSDSDERRVRAALIRLLVLGDDADPQYRLHEKGIQICGAWVRDRLDLEGCRGLRDVALLDSHIAEAPSLRSSQLVNLFLNRSRLPGLSADGLEAGGGVCLNGVEATGTVRLLGAKLGRDLDCTGAKFRAEKDAQGNPGGALSADGLEAGGGVFLRDVEATGEVRLLGAKIGGDLDCDNAKFRAEKDALGNSGDALSADRLEAGGGVFLRGVEATGVMRLHGAKIGGDLACYGAKFRAEKDAQGNPGNALSVDGLEAGGGVFLRGVEVTGEVRLLGAKLGGNLDCTDAKFRAKKEAQGSPGNAFVADGLQVGGDVFLGGVEATGEVRLLGAKLGGDLECERAKFRGETDGEGLKGPALSLSGSRVEGAFFLRNDAKVDGVLDLSAAHVGHLSDAEASWPGPGLLILDRFQYGAITGAGAPVDASRRLDWLGRQNPARWGADFWPQPYEQLAKVLREMGHGDDARTVLIGKERGRRAAELRRVAWWRKPLHWGFTQLLRIVGYGYQPALALYPALAVVLLGWGVMCWAADAGVMVPATPAGAVVLVPFAYSFEAFVPIVTLGQTDVFRPDMTTGAGWWLQVYLWVHGLAGWLIGGIAAAGVLGVFRRE